MKSFYATALIILSVTSAAYPPCALAQNEAEGGAPTMLERVRSLKVDSLHRGIWVYYSSGYAERAQKLGPLLSGAIRFFNDSLGVDLNFRLALVDSSAWTQLAPYPYGLPYVEGSEDEDSPVAVLPAEGDGAVYDFAVQLEQHLPQETQQRLEATGQTWEEAVRSMLDLISLHELGHAYQDAYGIGSPARWFDEFMANYFAYLYMHHQRPQMADVWTITGEAIRKAYDPQHRTLEAFERLYSKVGVADYAWYQSAFEMRANPLAAKQGFSFVRRMKEIYPTGTEEVPPRKVLTKLEAVAPGFQQWATVFDAD